ncbi:MULTISPECIES: antitoxin [Streptomyces]|uniref:antitoxin n=1 Tax=Streptomyces TaxID=1883 RepID=UPI0014323D61|nr:antitoxin [Streptomyces sp. C1-2]NJP70445.1 antitoxin [Streptomyces sp. C1-2]
MGLFDNVKARLGPAKDKVSDLADQHGDRIERGIDRAARVVDEKTGGKYRDRIRTGSGKAKHAMERLGRREPGDEGDDGGAAPPPVS